MSLVWRTGERQKGRLERALEGAMWQGPGDFDHLAQTFLAAFEKRGAQMSLDPCTLLRPFSRHLKIGQECVGDSAVDFPETSQRRCSAIVKSDSLRYTYRNPKVTMERYTGEREMPYHLWYANLQLGEDRGIKQVGRAQMPLMKAVVSIPCL